MKNHRLNEPWLTLDRAREFVRDGSGRRVRVAVLDSGVDAGHPDLAGLELQDDISLDDKAGQIQVTSNREGDRYGHGTAICGILRRLAPEVEIGSFQVLGANLRSRTSIIREGAREAIRRGYHVLHCSFGCARQDLVLDYKQWVDEAYVNGRHIVAATNCPNGTAAEWPAHFSSVNAVTYAHTPAHHTGYFLLTGSLTEFAAPGDGITVPWLNHAQIKVTGSSFAAPVVTAMLARLLGSAPGLSPLQAKALLRLLAEKSGQPTLPAAVGAALTGALA